MSIDLSTCKPGQRVRLADGQIWTFAGLTRDLEPNGDPRLYPYRVRCSNRSLTGYTQDGKFIAHRGGDHRNIVEILPLETPTAEPAKPVIDLRTCVPGQKLRLRDGRMATYISHDPGRACPHTIHIDGGSPGATRTDDGKFMRDGADDDRRTVIEILPLETQTNMSTTTQSKPKTPKEIYLAGQAAADFKPGERVKVLFKVPGNAGGWTLSWNSDDQVNMDTCVGKVFTVDGVQGTDGIRLDTTTTVPGCACDFKFPYFCLERVAPEPVKVVLNDTWTAEVVSKDEVKVGCQMFSVSLIRTMLVSIDALPAKGSRLNSTYVAEWSYPAPTSVKVHGREIPVENLRKLLSAVDAFAG